MSAASEFVGNALCLDFANTVDRRPHPARDTLDTAPALLRWAADGGVPLDAAVSDVEAALPALRLLREAVYDVFAAVAGGDDLPEEAMTLISSTYADGLERARWERAGSHAALVWPEASPEALGWRVAASAVDLLRAGPLERLGSCPACRWLFLDTSRNGRRRWCSMETCGSRAKSARYFAKSKSG